MKFIIRAIIGTASMFAAYSLVKEIRSNKAEGDRLARIEAILKHNAEMIEKGQYHKTLPLI